MESPFPPPLSYTAAATSTMIAAAAFSSLYIYRNLPSIPKDGASRPQELLDALANDEDIYYFGVGSNLSRSKLENRSISGQMIKPISMEPCIIHDCRLAFNMKALPPIEPAMGSLEPLPSFFDDNKKKGGRANNKKILSRRSSSMALIGFGERECHGALIKLTAHDYNLVYLSEGGGLGANSGYEEIMVECVPYDKSKPPVMAVAFRVREHRALQVDACPSKRYMTIIREGAAELGLSDEYQQWLKEHPVQDPHWLTRKVGKYSLLLTFSVIHGLKLPLFGDVQRILLFKVYVLPTEPKWKQILGEIASVMIMLPTACLGFSFRKILDITGLMPPPLKKWLSQMDESS